MHEGKDSVFSSSNGISIPSWPLSDSTRFVAFFSFTFSHIETPLSPFAGPTASQFSATSFPFSFLCRSQRGRVHGGAVLAGNTLPKRVVQIFIAFPTILQQLICSYSAVICHALTLMTKLRFSHSYSYSYAIAVPSINNSIVKYATFPKSTKEFPTDMRASMKTCCHL